MQTCKEFRIINIATNRFRIINDNTNNNTNNRYMIKTIIIEIRKSSNDLQRK